MAIVGCGGTGKSTLARALGRCTGLPVVHLDSHYWKPGWEPLSDAEWRARTDELIAEPRWIIDGNYGGTMERRLQRADAIVFLDFPRWRSIAGVLRRRVEFAGRTRPCMTVGCPERLSAEFLAYVWRYNVTRRAGVLERIERHRDGRHVAVLKTPRDVRAFLRPA